MIRAVRYASRFRFAIDPKTLEAIITHAEELFPAVAIERVWQELHKMPHLDEAIPLLHRLGLFEVIFPMWKGKGEPRIPKLSKQVPTLLHRFDPFFEQMGCRYKGPSLLNADNGLL